MWGAAEIVAGYRLFGAAPHVEHLIDRQGYLRARWLAVPAGINPLLAEIQELNAEKIVAPLPAEHVH